MTDLDENGRYRTTLYVLDAETGAERWHTEILDNATPPSRLSLAISGSLLFAPRNLPAAAPGAPRASAFDIATGTVHWTSAEPVTGTYAAAFGSLYVSDGTHVHRYSRDAT
jgi:outer membrane protein assembly factor BamB